MIIKYLFCLLFVFGTVFAADAQILEIIKAVTTKVIKAIDLKVQEEQNRVMVLQLAQKQLENELSQRKLNEIANWLDKQQRLYGEYYNSLQTDAPVLRDYRKVANVIAKQKQVLFQYNECINTIKQVSSFTPAQAQQLATTCDEILEQSLTNLDEMIMVVTSTNLKMNQAERMQAINRCDKMVSGQLKDIKSVYQNITTMVTQKTKATKETRDLKQLYGL